MDLAPVAVMRVRVRCDHLAFYCGLRACEAKALRWQDVDWSGPLLHASRWSPCGAV